MRVFGLTVGKRVKDLKTEVRRLRRDIKQKDGGGCASGAESGSTSARSGTDSSKSGSAHAGTGHGAAGAEAPGGAVLQGPAEIDPSATRPEGGPKYRAEAAPEGPGAGGQRGRCAAAGGLPDVSRGDRARAGSRTKTRKEIGRRVHVTRFRVHIGHCVACGTRVQGRHPSQTSEATGAAAAQVGPEALAFAAILNQEFGLSYGKTVAVRQRGFGLNPDAGGLEPGARRASRRGVSPPMSTAKRWSGPSPASRWMRPAGASAGTRPGCMSPPPPTRPSMASSPGRGVDAAAALIGADYDGGLVRDGWAPYRRCEAAYHQTCTQHLINRCDALIRQATPAGAGFPEQIKAILQQGLRLRDRYAAGTGSVHGLAVATGRLEAQLARVLDRRSRLPDHRRLAHHLSRECDALFTYLRCPGLEATNYRGEHAIRPAVVTRTVWGGHRTATGAHTQEVLTSVLRTGHQHDNDPVPHLVALLRSPQPYVLDLDPSRASPH